MGGCTKGAETGPCLISPAEYIVTVDKTPDDIEKQFFTEAYRCCKKRHLKKNPNALYNVGVAVLHGLGTKKDPMKASLWFKGAADKGHKGAQLILAQMFKDGVGVPRDPQIAKKYLAVANE